MKREIKLLESSSTPKFEATINEHLNEGWKIKGNMIAVSSGITVMLYKKFKN